MFLYVRSYDYFDVWSDNVAGTECSYLVVIFKCFIICPFLDIPKTCVGYLVSLY